MKGNLLNLDLMHAHAWVKQEKQVTQKTSETQFASANKTTYRSLWPFKISLHQEAEKVILKQVTGHKNWIILAVIVRFVCFWKK